MVPISNDVLSLSLKTKSGQKDFISDSWSIEIGRSFIVFLSLITPLLLQQL